MNFRLNKLTKVLPHANILLSTFLYLFLLCTMFASFFYQISKTSNSLVSNDIYSKEATANVSSFITDSTETQNTVLLSYLNNFFLTRNESFLSGNVYEMYNFYDLSHSYSKYSLHHEFKRISYLRDWANERGISFVDISSTPHILKTQTKDNIIKLDVSEIFSLTYTYLDNPTVKNNFSITFFHTEELQIIGNGFTIQKDYYFDCFEKSLRNYTFDLTEKELPLTTYRTYKINSTESKINLNQNSYYLKFTSIN